MALELAENYRPPKTSHGMVEVLSLDTWQQDRQKSHSPRANAGPARHVPKTIALMIAAASTVFVAQPAYAETILAPGNSIEYEWEPSSGPVEEYVVLLSRNGEEFKTAGIVTAPRMTITGATGESVELYVIGLANNQTKWSVASETSDVLVFLPEPEGWLGMLVGVMSLALVGRYGRRYRG